MNFDIINQNNIIRFLVVFESGGIDVYWCIYVWNEYYVQSTL